jgi:type IV secretory pathway VirB2 component (pilin)
MNMFPRYVQSREVSYAVCVSVLCLMLAAPAWAQGASPWETAVNVLQLAFTSTIARGLSLVAIVVSGLTFAFAPSRQTSATP